MSGILIVDDNESMRHLLRTFVESKTKFLVCGSAANGMEAIEKAQQLHPDLVLLDLSMPILNGAEAAVVLKGIMPETKIILFTMHGDNIGESLAVALGIDLVLAKADGLLHLEEHLNALLDATTDAVPN